MKTAHTLSLNGKDYAFYPGIGALMSFAANYQNSIKQIDLKDLEAFDEDHLEGIMKMFATKLKVFQSSLEFGAELEDMEYGLSLAQLEVEFTKDMTAFHRASEIFTDCMISMNNGEVPKKTAGVK